MTRLSPTVSDRIVPPCPVTVGARKPGKDATGTSTPSVPISSAAGRQPEPRTTARSCLSTPVWAARAAAGKQPKARPPKPYVPPERAPGEINVSDPDSRRLKGPRGYLQGYNAQAAVTEGQVVIAAEVNADAPDFGHLEPMVSAAQDELERAGLSDKPGVVVADAGYWNQEHMEAVVNRGIQIIVRPDAANRRSPRPGWEGGLYAFMRRVLQTELGGRLYRQRQAMIEPVLADTKFNRRIDRFVRRGRAAARSEWRLITATHNLLKLHRHSLQAATA